MTPKVHCNNVAHALRMTHFSVGTLPDSVAFLVAFISATMAKFKPLSMFVSSMIHYVSYMVYFRSFVWTIIQAVQEEPTRECGGKRDILQWEEQHFAENYMSK